MNQKRKKLKNSVVSLFWAILPKTHQNEIKIEALNKFTIILMGQFYQDLKYSQCKQFNKIVLYYLIHGGYQFNSQKIMELREIDWVEDSQTVADDLDLQIEYLNLQLFQDYLKALYRLLTLEKDEFQFENFYFWIIQKIAQNSQIQKFKIQEIFTKNEQNFVKLTPVLSGQFELQQFTKEVYYSGQQSTLGQYSKQWLEQSDDESVKKLMQDEKIIFIVFSLGKSPKIINLSFSINQMMIFEKLSIMGEIQIKNILEVKGQKELNVEQRVEKLFGEGKDVWYLENRVKMIFENKRKNLFLRILESNQFQDFEWKNNHIIHSQSFAFEQDKIFRSLCHQEKSLKITKILIFGPKILKMKKIGRKISELMTLDLVDYLTLEESLFSIIDDDEDLEEQETESDDESLVHQSCMTLKHYLRKMKKLKQKLHPNLIMRELGKFMKVKRNQLVVLNEDDLDYSKINLVMKENSFDKVILLDVDQKLIDERQQNNEIIWKENNGREERQQINQRDEDLQTFLMNIKDKMENEDLEIQDEKIKEFIENYEYREKEEEDQEDDKEDKEEGQEDDQEQQQDDQQNQENDKQSIQSLKKIPEKQICEIFFSYEKLKNFIKKYYKNNLKIIQSNHLSNDYIILQILKIFNFKKIGNIKILDGQDSFKDLLTLDRNLDEFEIPRKLSQFSVIDPVEYNQGKIIEGIPDYCCEIQERIYCFQNGQNLDQFVKDYDDYMVDNPKIRGKINIHLDCLQMKQIKPLIDELINQYDMISVNPIEIVQNLITDDFPKDNYDCSFGKLFLQNQSKIVAGLMKGDVIETRLLSNLILFEMGVTLEKKLIGKEFEDDLVYFKNKKKWRKGKVGKMKLEDFVTLNENNKTKREIIQDLIDSSDERFEEDFLNEIMESLKDQQKSKRGYIFVNLLESEEIEEIFNLQGININYHISIKTEEENMPQEMVYSILESQEKYENEKNINFDSQDEFLTQKIVNLIDPFKNKLDDGTLFVKREENQLQQAYHLCHQYCPVSLIEENWLIKGNSEFSLIIQNEKINFYSEEKMEKFRNQYEFYAESVNQYPKKLDKIFLITNLLESQKNLLNLIEKITGFQSVNLVKKMIEIKNLKIFTRKEFEFYKQGYQESELDIEEQIKEISVEVDEESLEIEIFKEILREKQKIFYLNKLEVGEGDLSINIVDLMVKENRVPDHCIIMKDKEEKILEENLKFHEQNEENKEEIKEKISSLIDTQNGLIEQMRELKNEYPITIFDIDIQLPQFKIISKLKSIFENLKIFHETIFQQGKFVKISNSEEMSIEQKVKKLIQNPQIQFFGNRLHYFWQPNALVKNLQWNLVYQNQIFVFQNLQNLQKFTQDPTIMKIQKYEIEKQNFVGFSCMRLDEDLKRIIKYQFGLRVVDLETIKREVTQFSLQNYQKENFLKFYQISQKNLQNSQENLFSKFCPSDSKLKEISSKVKISDSEKIFLLKLWLSQNSNVLVEKFPENANQAHQCSNLDLDFIITDDFDVSYHLKREGEFIKRNLPQISIPEELEEEEIEKFKQDFYQKQKNQIQEFQSDNRPHFEELRIEKLAIINILNNLNHFIYINSQSMSQNNQNFLNFLQKIHQKKYSDIIDYNAKNKPILTPSIKENRLSFCGRMDYYQYMKYKKMIYSIKNPFYYMGKQYFAGDSPIDLPLIEKFYNFNEYPQDQINQLHSIIKNVQSPQYEGLCPVCLLKNKSKKGHPLIGLKHRKLEYSFCTFNHQQNFIKNPHLFYYQNKKSKELIERINSLKQELTQREKLHQIISQGLIKLLNKKPIWFCEEMKKCFLVFLGLYIKSQNPNRNKFYRSFWEAKMYEFLQKSHRIQKRISCQKLNKKDRKDYIRKTVVLKEIFQKENLMKFLDFK